MGCNNKLMGGYAGLGTGLCFATKYQGEATLRAHGFVSLGSMYQYHTLDEIRKLIEEDVKRISPEEMLQRITKFVEHLQREYYVNDEQHQQQLYPLEEEFHSNNSGPSRNIHLSPRAR
eukprot:9124000-Karenia_brevis.AAC.1